MKLYLVTNSDNQNIDEFIHTVEQAIIGGVDFVQIREKDKSAREIMEICNKLKPITSKYNVPLIIDDRIDIAIACELDGVHVGQSDIPVCYARKILGKNKIVGATAKTLDQAKIAISEGASYLGVGAIYETTTKVKTNLTSIETLTQICKNSSIPVVAIGGLNESNLAPLKNSGICGIAVVSCIMQSKTPKQTATQLIQQLNNIL